VVRFIFAADGLCFYLWSFASKSATKCAEYARIAFFDLRLGAQRVEMVYQLNARELLQAGWERRRMMTGEFKRGWSVVMSAAVGIGLGLSPLPFYTIGVFVSPLAAEFGWSVSDVFLALPIYTFGVLFMSPIVGLLSDRFGVRRVAIVSVFLFSITMMAQSLNTGSKTLYTVLWILMAVTGRGNIADYVYSRRQQLVLCRARAGARHCAGHDRHVRRLVENFRATGYYPL